MNICELNKCCNCLIKLDRKMFNIIFSIVILYCYYFISNKSFLYVCKLFL